MVDEIYAIAKCKKSNGEIIGICVNAFSTIEKLIEELDLMYELTEDKSVYFDVARIKIN